MAMNSQSGEPGTAMGPPETSSSEHQKAWVPVLKIENWGNKLSGGRVVRHGSNRLAVFRYQGNWYATDDACPHQRIGLSGGALEEETVACPGHGWRFSLVTGKVVNGPAGLGVRVYPIRERGGILEVSI